MEREHRGKSLWNRFTRNNSNLFDRHFLCLIRRHDDVLVIGKNDDFICGEILKGVQNILRGWIHRLPTLYYCGRAQAGKDATQARAR
jgi:hypothetical protein